MVHAAALVGEFDLVPQLAVIGRNHHPMFVKQLFRPPRAASLTRLALVVFQHSAQSPCLRDPPGCEEVTPFHFFEEILESLPVA